MDKEFFFLVGFGPDAGPTFRELLAGARKLRVLMREQGVKRTTKMQWVSPAHTPGAAAGVRQHGGLLQWAK